MKYVDQSGLSYLWTKIKAKIAAVTPASIGAAAASHSHTIANVTGLQAALDGKAAASHTQAVSTVTGLQVALDGKAASNHNHDGTYGALTYTATIPISGWTKNAATNLYEVTVTVSGMQTAYSPVADINASTATAAQMEAYETAWALIKGITIQVGSIKVRATEVPGTTIPIIMKVR